MLTYVKGDVTNPIDISINNSLFPGLKFCVHVCNNVGAWGAGVSGAIGKAFPEAEKEYRNWVMNSSLNGYPPFMLGEILPVQVKNRPIVVVNLIGQNGLVSKYNRIPVRYDSIQEGLSKVANLITKSSTLHNYQDTVHMPRIGCGLAGGKWDRIEPLIVSEIVSKGIPVVVYDLP